MVTITLRPILRYSPSPILCEKRPELSFPKSLTPFSLAALLALSSSKEGLAAVSMLIVLVMPGTFFARLASTHPSLRAGACFARGLGGNRTRLRGLGVLRSALRKAQTSARPLPS